MSKIFRTIESWRNFTTLEVEMGVAHVSHCSSHSACHVKRVSADQTGGLHARARRTTGGEESHGDCDWWRVTWLPQPETGHWRLRERRHREVWHCCRYQPPSGALLTVLVSQVSPRLKDRRLCLQVLGDYNRQNKSAKEVQKFIKEIESISSQPLRDHFFNVSDEVALLTIVDTLGNKIFALEGIKPQ